MSNISSTTTTTVPPPQATTLYSTTTTVAQTSTDSTTTVWETTTIYETTQPPITTDVTVTTNPPISTQYADKSPSNPGAIVGGVIAGVVVAVVIIVIVIFVLRRRRRRSDGGVQCAGINKLPGKEDLEVHKTLEPTEKLYVNVSKTGETDESTDPSVDDDGYQKKNTIHYHKAPTKTHRNDSNGGNKSPQKSNKTRPRVDSMPSHQAPSPPGADADKAGYSTARVGEVKVANTVSGYTDVRVPDPGEYMEMSYGESANAEVVQSQSQVTNNGNIGGKTGDKLYVNENVLNPANPDNTKIYENVNSQDYKNVPSGKGYDNVINEQSNAVNQPYANVGTEDADVEPVQDDVYEIP